MGGRDGRVDTAVEVTVLIMPYEQGGALDRGVAAPGAGDLHLSHEASALRLMGAVRG